MCSRQGTHDFNSRPREGANFSHPSSRNRIHQFQFPPPRGGEHDPESNRAEMAAISIPAPARGRTLRIAFNAAVVINFNSRPREGANESWMPALGTTGKFQFPPPRGGEPDFCMIHSSADPISIPAPARGRTAGGSPHGAGPGYFNSRPREGANLRLISAARWRYQISIPAPARGRTLPNKKARPQNGFQFPPPRGGEPRPKVPRITLLYFNSRPREGANAPRQAGAGQGQFQFPPPRGGEPRRRGQCVSLGQFQFPPPRGGERRLIHPMHGLEIFQFPPPRGGEHRRNAEHAKGLLISIPAPARGRTLYQKFILTFLQNFNSRPREGANTATRTAETFLSNFNSRPREGANGR